MLEVEALVSAYGRVTAVHGISLHVAQGEAVALVGPNGAGKTTTLATIAGLKTLRSGAIRLGGRLISGWPPEKIARSGLALIPEGRRIFGRLSVEENLSLGCTMRSARDARGDLEKMLERFPVLRTHLRSPAAVLSGGQQQQLAIARALLCRPQLLLVDEPSLGLSPQMTDLVFDELSALRDDGVTILLVEQSTQLAVEFADRSYVLRTGRIVLEGSRDDLLDSHAIEAAYFGDPPAAVG